MQQARAGQRMPRAQRLNRNHAILGASEHCVAVHPSDLCVALAALEAQVLVRGRAGERRVAFADFHRLPADTPERDNCLAVDELVTAIELPAPRFARHCHYLKVRDRASYAFALVSVAAALEPDGERIGELRLALGGVAHKPWRVAELEERFQGHPANRDSYVRFAEALLRDARPLAHNAFKIGLARNAIVRALEEAHSGGIGQ